MTSKGLSDIMEEMRKTFVTIETFTLKITPLERIIYGFVSLLLVTVATILIGSVLRVRI